MQVDTEYLRQLYASLSDQALLAINRAELVEAAQQCYEDELGRRKLALRRPGAGEEPDEEKPDWLEDAAEVFSRTDLPGQVPAPEVADARDALEAAGIPCYLDRAEIPEESVSSQPTHIWRLRVPGNLNLQAMSVLDRDIFNADFEATWKTHLEMLSDEDLPAMAPQVVFCGLFDRVERVTRAYDEEMARRNLKGESGLD
jgi:hypothetical protein